VNKENVTYLKKLKGVLDKIMGSTKLGYKYKNALDDAVDSLEATETVLTTEEFTVNCYNENGVLIVDVIHNHSGSIIKTLEYDSINVIDESQIGES
tara:strand:- start:3375 stop:3662 length:288 start_codon:yes stop_codon:yes gene_type:complete